MKKISLYRQLIVCLIVLLAIPVLKGNPLDSVPAFSYTLVVDTINLRYPDLKVPYSCSEAGLIDLKRFNDTLFLFVIPANQDTVNLYILYFDDKFILKEKRPIKLKTHALSFVQPSWTNLTMIHYDTIALLGEHEVLFYDLANHDLFYTHTLEPDQYFLTYNSPVQHIPGTSLVVSEYYASKEQPIQRVALIDYTNHVLRPLPFYVSEHEFFQSWTAEWNFAVLDSRIASKYSFLPQFCVWDLIKEKVDEVPVMPHGLPDTLYIPQEMDFEDFSGMTRAKLLSHEQVGMAYNRDRENLAVIYMLPADKNDIQGFKIPPRDILCLFYDTHFNTTGKLELHYPYVFIPTLFYRFDNKLFMISTLQNFLVHVVNIND